MINNVPLTYPRRHKLRALAESPTLLLITRGLIGILFCIASFLAVRVEQDHDTTTGISVQLAGIKEAITAATANRYTSIDAERDKVLQSQYVGALRDDFMDQKTVTRQVLSNHENRILILERMRH